MRNSSIETPRTSGEAGPTTDQAADRTTDQTKEQAADRDQQKDPRKPAADPAAEREPGKPVTPSRDTERSEPVKPATPGRDTEAARSATTSGDTERSEAVKPATATYGTERSDGAKTVTPSRDAERSEAVKPATTTHGTGTSTGTGTDRRAAAAGSVAGHTTASATETAPGADVAGRLGRRMDHAIGGFVDDPRRSVREADDVLDEAIKHMARLVESRRSALRSGCKDGAGTEELRVALTRYRDMTDELLAL